MATNTKLFRSLSARLTVQFALLFAVGDAGHLRPLCRRSSLARHLARSKTSSNRAARSTIGSGNSVLASFRARRSCWRAISASVPRSRPVTRPRWQSALRQCGGAATRRNCLHRLTGRARSRPLQPPPRRRGGALWESLDYRAPRRRHDARRVATPACRCACDGAEPDWLGRVRRAARCSRNGLP